MTMNDRPKSLLIENLEDLQLARKHLDFSYAQVKDWDKSLDELDENQLESVEAFTSRFARSVDLLVNKVLRSLDRYELKSGGSLLDVVNRAEGRGFLDDANELREMKDIRNVIAHDYAGQHIERVLIYCKEKKPYFDSICDKLNDYVKQLILPKI